MAIAPSEVTRRIPHARSRSSTSRRTRRPTAPRIVLTAAATLHRLLYRWSGGRLGGTLRGGSVLLLTTTGRKTGQARTWPLSYLVRGDDLVLVASAGGAPHHPAWYLNLQADPRVRIQVADRTWPMAACIARGIERDRLWAQVVRRYPVTNRYQRKTSRPFPVVILHRPTLAPEPPTATGRPPSDVGDYATVTM